VGSTGTRPGRWPVPALVWLVALLWLVLFPRPPGQHGAMPLHGTRAWLSERWRDAGRARVEARLEAAGWHLRAGAGVRVWYPDGEAASAATAGAMLERLLPEVRAMLGAPGPAGAVVVLHPSPGDLARGVGQGAGFDAAGTYHRGVIRLVSAAFWTGGGPDPALAACCVGPAAHELAHWVADVVSRGNLPRWFSEGVAQWVEARLAGGLGPPARPAAGRAYSVLALHWAFGRLPDQDLAYYQAWQFVELLAAAGGPEAVGEVLFRLGRGEPLDRAVAASAGVSFRELERRWRQSVMAGNPWTVQN